MKVLICCYKQSSDVVSERVKALVIQDLKSLSLRRRIEPIILDSSLWLLPVLSSMVQPVSSVVWHYTLRTLPETRGVIQKFTVSPTKEAVAACDLAVLYVRPEEDHTFVQDMMLETDKEWIERSIEDPGKREDPLAYEPLANKWFHALEKVERKMVHMPNQGLQTRLRVDFRPPRNPND